MSIQWVSECSQVSLGGPEWEMDTGLVQVRIGQVSQTTGQMEDDALLVDAFCVFSHLLFV